MGCPMLSGQVLRAWLGLTHSVIVSLVVILACSSKARKPARDILVPGACGVASRVDVGSASASVASNYDQPLPGASIMSQTYRPRGPWGDCQNRPAREDRSIAAGFSITLAATRARYRGITSHLSLLVNMLFLLFLFSNSALAQRDPVSNFCRRFGHQTAVVDRKLYIDGGFINYAPLPSNPTNYTSMYPAVSHCAGKPERVS